MATTKIESTDKPARVKKVPPSLVDRTKNQLSQAALKNKISLEELGALKSHIEKLTALLGD